MNVSEFGKGLKPRSPDPRDVLFKDLIPLGAPAVDWNKGYDVRLEIGDLKVENQGPSQTCVGQSTSKLAEVLNRFEEGRFIDLSPRDIYSHIFITPDGGAWLYKGPSYLVARGNAEELVVPSYMYPDKEPPTEAFMRIKDDSDRAVQNAGIRKAKGYAVVSPNIDEMALAIQNNKAVILGFAGSNEGWQTAFPIPPQDNQALWGHAVLAIGFKMIDGRKHLIFLNSWSNLWGDNGFGYLSQNYFDSGKVFNGYTVVDLPNQYLKQISMKDLIMLSGTSDQFLVSSGRKLKIPDIETRDYLRDIVEIITGEPRVVEQEEFNSFATGKSMPSVKGDQFVRDAYAFYKEKLPLLQDIVDAE